MPVTDTLVPFQPAGYPAMEDGAKLWAVDNYNGASNAVTVIIETMKKLEAATSPAGHTHTIADVTGLQAALDSKALNTEEYFVKTASAGLTAERVVTDTATVAWDFATASQAKANVPNSSITYAKLQDISAALRVLGRKTAGAGVAEEVTLSEFLDFIGSAAQGDILYRGSAGWSRLPAGTVGDFLKTQGAGADPAWATVTPGGLTRITSVGAGAGTSLTITGLGGYKILWVFLRDVSHNNGTTSSALRVALSGNGGSSFGTPMSLGLALNFSQFYTAEFAISNCDQVNNQTVTMGQFFANASANLLTDTSSRGPINALQFDFATSSNFDSGTFDIYGLK